ncbi:Hypothetical protein A7982_01333 [Minicystis rosea]|nr:Hypothetical protein A7982_01333 [Minicystis rosea]
METRHRLMGFITAQLSDLDAIGVLDGIAFIEQRTTSVPHGPDLRALRPKLDPARREARA